MDGNLSIKVVIGLFLSAFFCQHLGAMTEERKQTKRKGVTGTHLSNESVEQAFCVQQEQSQAKKARKGAPLGLKVSNFTETPQLTQKVAEHDVDDSGSLVDCSEELLELHEISPGTDEDDLKELVNGLVDMRASYISNRLTKAVSPKSVASDNDESLMGVVSTYKEFYDRSDGAGILGRLHSSACLFINSRKDAQTFFQDSLEEKESLSVEQIDLLIKNIRTALSYGATVEKIESFYNYLSDKHELIEERFQEIFSSKCYTPWKNQTVTQAVIGYLFLPIQCDHVYESVASLVQRAPIQFLIAYSAVQNNLLALHYLAHVAQAFELDEESLSFVNDIDEKIEEAFGNLDMEQSGGSLFYVGALCLSRLEQPQALKYFEMAAAHNDPRAVYELLRLSTAHPEKATNLVLLKKYSHELYYLTRASEELSITKRKLLFTVAGCFGSGFAFSQLAHECKETPGEAVSFLCAAFENGHYEVLDDILNYLEELNEPDCSDDSVSLLRKLFCQETTGELFQKLKIVTKK